MKQYHPTTPVRALKLLALCGLALWLQPSLKADVIVLQDGTVLTGNVLQQDGEGVLFQSDSGTFRYPPSFLRDVKKEAAAAPHVSNNGQRIPDWAQIITLLANTGWSQGLKQVPATMIESGIWKNVPYISFKCRSGGYELNIFGDLNKPAAVQIGAMTYLKESTEAKSNCVNLICSLLANADDQKMVRALNWKQKDTEKNGEMIIETAMPGEWGSYGGWWVSIYSETALANAQASDAELLTLTQPRNAALQPAPATDQPATAAQPAATTAGGSNPSGAATPQPATTIQPAATTPVPTTVTTYETVPVWSDAELAEARRVTPAGPGGPGAAGTPGVPGAAGAHPADAAAKVYPRTYTRTGGTYGNAAAPRR